MAIPKDRFCIRIVITLVVLAALGLIAFALQGCGTTPPPVPTGDQRFAGFHDCSDDPTGFAPTARELAAACGDRADTAACFTEVADQGGDPTQLLCAARDIETADYIEMGKGLDWPARAARLREWLKSTGARLRGQP